jgi:CBS domain-containing protein
MKVKDIMTRNVAAVGQDATLKQIATLMAERGVSGVPVISAEKHVFGVVTEADIILKAANRAESGGVLGHLFPGRAVDERRLNATRAAEAMTSPSVNIEQDRSVAEAAKLMVDHKVKRLPVVSDGRLVGIVSRADIVRAFTRSDGEIWEELRNHVLLREFWLSPDELNMTVEGGQVRVTGEVGTKMMAELIEALVWRVPGVVTVDCSDVTWKVDDRAERAPQAEGARR